MSGARKGKRNNVRYQQFQGGYARVAAAQLQGLLEGYRLGIFRRNEVRVFAGRWEREALHRDSLVTLYRVINCQSQRKGNRRLSHAAIAAAAATLDEHLPRLQEQCAAGAGEANAELKPVARRLLRHVAHGGATTVEALMCFAYFLRRIPQRKPLQRLRPEEHYARFRYAEFEAWTGVHRATQSRTLLRLMHRGYLNVVPVHKQNENAYGQLFVDGGVLSLVRPRQGVRRKTEKQEAPGKVRVEKRSTPLALLDNASRKKKSSLRNSNPKTEIRDRECFIMGLKKGVLARSGDAELVRIALRAAQIEEQRLWQVA